ncbi:SAM-dependent methyltransferase [Nonomuraea sediminis]|uniref:SAM-dependent methyltransferase n=1 Tax=Nonomuraea sediminis TaxID=2835864 RepID=UPI001BDDA3F4|nr:SAM-dependent methyltransferase [Nonomuraea sediminis]
MTEHEPPQLDTSTPHSARVWNYWIGGKDNYPVDREVGDQVMAAYPDIVEIARQSRHFLARAVRFLTGQAGIDQFLDLGTGLPTVDNTHEVAQRAIPTARIVYVDNDPLVLVHARALLTSTPEGVTDYIDADVHDVERILRDAAATLDLSRPVAVMMLGILGNVADYREARDIVRRLMAAVPSGSYLVVNDGTKDAKAEEAQAAADMRAEAGDPYRLSTPAEIEAYFEGLELVEPGVVRTAEWRPELHQLRAALLDVHCGVARKP